MTDEFAQKWHKDCSDNCMRAIQAREKHHPRGAGDCLQWMALANVNWCREISGSDFTRFEVGARFYLPDY